jgi:hypothetical protein
MLKRSIIALSIAVAAASCLAAEIGFSIHFFDKRIYFPGDPVPVKVTLMNDSAETYHFKLADDKMYSLRFELRNTANRQIPASDSFIRKQSLNQPVFFRELSLEPGEEYSFIEDAASYLSIGDSGSYTLVCRFFPELLRTETKVPGIASNGLMLSMRPRSGVSPVAEMVTEEARDILKAQKLPPDEVVQRTIEARQKGLWSEFFLYFDLEGLLKRDPARNAAYVRESDEGRIRLLERFKADLMREVVDSDIITIPFDFTVLDTKYTPSSGQVRVLERFQHPGYFLKKEYTYYLKRSDDVWYIDDYSIVNKGTE